MGCAEQGGPGAPRPFPPWFEGSGSQVNRVSHTSLSVQWEGGSTATQVGFPPWREVGLSLRSQSLFEQSQGSIPDMSCSLREVTVLGVLDLCCLKVSSRDWDGAPGRVTPVPGAGTTPAPPAAALGPAGGTNNAGIARQSQPGLAEKVVVVSGFRLLSVPGGLGMGNGTSLHLPSANPQTNAALPSVQPEPPSPSHQPLNLNGFGQRKGH